MHRARVLDYGSVRLEGMGAALRMAAYKAPDSPVHPFVVRDWDWRTRVRGRRGLITGFEIAERGVELADYALVAGTVIPLWMMLPDLNEESLAAVLRAADTQIYGADGSPMSESLIRELSRRVFTIELPCVLETDVIAALEIYEQALDELFRDGERLPVPEKPRRPVLRLVHSATDTIQ